MATDALPVPHDLRPLLAKHTGVDWPAVAWAAVRARVAELERVEAVASVSRLSAAEAKALGDRLRGPDPTWTEGQEAEPGGGASAPRR